MKQKYIPSFVKEMQDYLPQMRAQLLSLSDPEQPKRGTLIEFRRFAHSVNGLGGLMELEDIQQVGEAIEEVILILIANHHLPHDIVMRALQGAIDYLQTRIESIALRNEAPPIPEASLQKVLALFAPLMSFATAPAFTGTRIASELISDDLFIADDILPTRLQSMLGKAANTSDPKQQMALPTVKEMAGLTPEEAAILAAFETDEREEIPSHTINQAVSSEEPAKVNFLYKYKLDLVDEIPADMLEFFVIEANEDLGVLQEGLAALEQAPNDEEAIKHVQRIAHKIKGAAGTVGFGVATTIAHWIEDLVGAIKDGQITSGPSVTAALIHGINALEDTLQGIIRKGKEDPLVLVPLSAEYDHLLQKSTPHRKETVQPTATGLAVLDRQAGSRGQLSLQPVVDDSTLESPETAYARHVSDLQEPATATSGRELISDHYIRVDLRRLNQLMNKVAELAVNRSGFEQGLSRANTVMEEMRLSLAHLANLGYQLSGYEMAGLGGSTFLPVEVVGPGPGNFGTEQAEGKGSGSSKRFTGPDIPTASTEKTLKKQGWDELEMDHYTEFHRLVRALTEAVSDIAIIGNEMNSVINVLNTLTNEQEGLSTNIQHDVMNLRLVPLSKITPRLQRAARTLTIEQEKQIDFILQGEDTEIDRNIIEEIADPLLHLVRNCIDHGLESPEERLEKGKNPTGTLRLRAYVVGTEVTIEVGDDGRGLNMNILVAEAMAKKFVTPQMIHTMTEKEKLDLIFMPGFSTRQQVTSISGRGIGMDIVKNTVERLKGSVQVQSEPGKGALFIIKLPISLGVIRALQVRVAGNVYLVPLQTVQRTITLEASKIYPIGNRYYTKLESETPVLYLSEILGLGMIPHQVETVLVIDVGNRQVAVVVDELLAEKEEVVKAIAPHLRQRGIAGATLTGSGEVLLILDFVELLSGIFSNQQPPSAVRHASVPKYTATIMVVDDSLSMRRALEKTLQRHGYEVVTAKDGLEALESLISTLPKVLVLDIEMPRLDGYELLSILRSQDNFKHIQIAMLTSRGADKHKKRAIELGANAYLVKPCPDDELLRVIGILARGETIEGRIGV